MSKLGSLATSKKVSVFVSYCMILGNTISNLVLTPLYFKHLGSEGYGLYQMVYSVAHYILVLDFGISLTMVKYLSLYKIQNLHSFLIQS